MFSHRENFTSRGSGTSQKHEIIDAAVFLKVTRCHITENTYDGVEIEFNLKDVQYFSYFNHSDRNNNLCVGQMPGPADACENNIPLNIAAFSHSVSH